MIGDLFEDKDGNFWIEIDVGCFEMQKVSDISKQCHLPKHTVWGEDDEIRADFLPSDIRKVGRDYCLGKKGTVYGFEYVYYRRSDIERIFMSRIKNIKNNIELKKFFYLYGEIINFW